MTPSPSPSSAVRAAVDELEGLLADASDGEWTVEYDHSPGDHASEDQVWIRGPYGETIAIVGERYTMAPKEAALIVAMHRALPHLLAAIKAVDELASGDEEMASICRRVAEMEHEKPYVREQARDQAAQLEASASRLRAALAAVDVTETAE